MLLVIIIVSVLIYLVTSINNHNKNDNSNIDPALKKIIKTIVRQAARWSTAARQDNNSMIAVLHANYGAGYLWALKDIATSEQIKLATNIDILQFEKEIVKTQDFATMRMAKLCPKYAPKSTYLTKLGGEGI